jgi:hypothetical protein
MGLVRITIQKYSITITKASFAEYYRGLTCKNVGYLAKSLFKCAFREHFVEWGLQSQFEKKPKKSSGSRPVS